MNQRMICALALAVVVALHVQSSTAQTDGAYIGKFKNVLKSLSNYRYGDISVFRIEAQFGELQRYLNPPPVDSTGSIEYLAKKDKGLLVEIQSAVRRSQIFDNIVESLEEKGYSPTDLSDKNVQNVIQYYLDERQTQNEAFTAAYIITSKYQRGESGEDLVVIALIKTRKKPSGNTIRDLSGVNLGDVITRFELTKLDPPPSSQKEYPDKMQGYLRDQVIQSNVVNVTLEAQGIDDPDTRFVRQVFGNAVQVPEDDVQQFIKITNGIPVSYVGPNELTVSAADLISYRRYTADPIKKQVTVIVKDTLGNDTDSSLEVETYNSRLPQYGGELRYGLEDINYPSVWSERMTLNAVWSQARLGIVLPTSGWASLSNTLGSQRTMTSAGFGVNANIEVPIKLIAESGVFNLAASYVFDDATKTSHQRFDTSYGRSFDHLVRFHASAQYTFAVRVDESNLFRLRLGGTGYSMERWDERDSISATGDTTKIFRMFDNEFIGGISGKIEFMNTSWSTPLGASLQYFDSSILANLWLQLQASEYLGFRIDANIFTPVFRDARAWENDAVFMPSIRAIFNF